MTNKLPLGVISPQAVTVLGTYRCTAACESCCFDSSPHVKGRLSLEAILQFIDEAADGFPSIGLVAFSGGECFLLGRDLDAAVSHATSRGLSTRCVTNGYWAKSVANGRKRLNGLVRAGLTELNVSTGDFHQRWVSERDAVTAVKLGIEAGLKTALMVELRAGSDVTVEGILERNPELVTLVDATGDDRLEIMASPWMPMSGELAYAQDPSRFVDRTNVHLRHGCKSILTTLVLTPSSRIGFCCGLSRERIPELNADWGDDEPSLVDAVESAGRDFMKIWLFVDGPERILAWAGSKNPQIEWEGRYAHHCHACLGLFTDPLVREVVLRNFRERIDDVLFRYSVLLREQEALVGSVYG